MKKENVMYDKFITISMLWIFNNHVKEGNPSIYENTDLEGIFLSEVS